MRRLSLDLVSNTSRYRMTTSSFQCSMTILSFHSGFLMTAKRRLETKGVAIITYHTNLTDVYEV